LGDSLKKVLESVLIGHILYYSPTFYCYYSLSLPEHPDASDIADVFETGFHKLLHIVDCLCGC
jgi:hypothetical protein